MRVPRSILVALSLTTAVAGCTTTIEVSAPPRSTSTTSGAATAAQQVTSCQQLHHMQFASEVTQDPTGQMPTFTENNGNPYEDPADPIYSGVASQSVVLVQSCAWPPPSGADQTGYSQILFTSAPGDTTWPGEMSTYAQADIVDSTCKTVTASYTGEHAGTTYTDTVTVSQNELALTEPGGTLGTFPGVAQGEAPDLAAWAQEMGYKLVPGESVILRNDPETVSAASCIG